MKGWAWWTLRRTWQRLPDEVKQLLVGALAGALVMAVVLRLAGW